MKISTCLCCMLLLSISLNAQFAKGSKLIGGNFNLFSSANTYNGVETKNMGLSSAPSVGKFYKQNRLFGVTLNLSATFRKDRADDYGYGAGIFFRQYKPLGKSALFLFIEENASGSHEKPKGFNSS